MILCCGEALIDMLPRQLDDGRMAYLPVPGGAVYNTAIALGRLGEEVGFFSGLSTDTFGQQLVSHLEESGVNAAFCMRSPKPTTMAFVQLTDGIAQYSFLDENTAGRMLGIDALPSLPESVQALHFGAISLISEPCGSTFEAFMKRSHQSRVISFDPNIRPGFVTDEPAYRNRLRRLVEMSDIIKISEEDLAWMEPGGHIEHIAHNWLERGASIVVLTMGEGGARAITKSLDLLVPANPVEVVDTVGAGDTFNAGFLASLRTAGVLSRRSLRSIDENSLREAIDYGARVAAYTVSQAGANPPWKHEIE